MAENYNEYKRVLREATISDQMKLFQLHLVIYVLVNAIWLALNAMNVININPAWATYYSPVGWGLLIIVHYVVYVRGAENLCRLREERVEAKMA